MRTRILIPFLLLIQMTGMTSGVLASDRLQETFHVSECHWNLIAKSLDEKLFLRYSKRMIAQLNAGEESAAEITETADNTTALRLEQKNWSTLPRIDATLEKLKAEFPTLRMRDGEAVGVSSDLYRTLTSETVLDRRTGRLVQNGRARVAEDPDRYERRTVNLKLRVRKYDGSPLTETRSKLEMKFQSLTDGVVYKPSALFDDADLRILLGPQAPDEQVLSEIRNHALQAGLRNDPREIDQILSAVTLIRQAHAEQGFAFEPIVHIRYQRTAYMIPIEHAEGSNIEKFDLQLTRDTQVQTMEPQIVPKILDPQTKLSNEIWAYTPDNLGVLEVKRPLSKAGVSERTRQVSRYGTDRVHEEFPEIAKVDSILSPVKRSAAQNREFRINKGKRYAAGHGALEDEDPLDDLE